MLSNYTLQKKCGYNREWIRPVLAVIDPTLFETIPKFQIAAGIADMMSHIFERYFSNTEHTELVDALAEATLRTLISFGPKVIADPSDYDAWSQIALCGTIAHNNMPRRGQRAGLGLPQAQPRAHRAVSGDPRRGACDPDPGRGCAMSGA